MFVSCLKVFLAVISFSGILSSDVLIETVGYVTNQVVFGNCLMVTSSNNYAACINNSSGEISWKFPLSPLSTHNKLTTGDKTVFILSKQLFQKEQFVTVQAISNHGHLVWEATLPSGPTYDEIVDFVYIERLRSVLCLFKKSIQLIDAVDGTEITLWNPSPDVELSFELQSLPNKFNKAEGYVAQGCFVGSSNSCEAVAFLSYDPEQKSFNVRKYESYNKKAFALIKPTLLTGFNSVDTLYSVKTAVDKQNLKLSVEFVFQAIHGHKISNKLTNVDLGQYGFENAEEYHIDSDNFVKYVSADDLRPTIVVTLKTDRRNALFIFEAFYTAEKWDMSLKLALHESSSTLSFVGVAKEFLDSSIVQAYEVVTVHHNENKGLQVLRQKNGFDITISTALYSRNDADIKFLIHGNTIYAVTNNGLILAVSSEKDSANQLKINWARNEGLGNIQEAFIISPEEVSNADLSSQSTFDLLNIFANAPIDRKHQVFVAASYERSARLSFADTRLQLHFIDLSSNGCYLRSLRPVLSSALGKSVVVRSIRIIPVFNFEEHHHSANNVTLVVDTEEDGVILWKIDVKSLLSSTLRSKCSSPGTVPDILALENTDTIVNVGNLLSLHPSSTNLVKMGGEITMLLANNEEAKVVTTHASSHPADASKSVHFHSVNATKGVITIYQNTANDCPDFGVPTASCKQGVETAQIVFDPEVEKIADVTYPTFGDKVYSRAATLGDSNVLLKYLNPNLMVVVTTSVNSLEDNSNNIEPKLFVNIFDTVSGKLMQRIAHENAAQPVASVIIENFVVVSYWNTKAKRTEVSSIGLYDGFIGKYDFSAFKSDSKFSGKNSPFGAVRSGYSTTLPLVMQRTYVVPGKILHLSHTVSGKGINNKNLLVAFSSGQIYNLDFRMFHPRRPLSDPTPAEKEEGLIKYFPFIFLPPTAMISMNSTISLSDDLQVISASSKLESRSLIVSYGAGCDIFLKTIIPSQGFDTLSEDFNYMLLIALIGGLAAIVFALYIASAKVTLQRLWR